MPNQNTQAAETEDEIVGIEDDELHLSPRQHQILMLLQAGDSNKEIAAKLNIGVGTVKQHLVVLYRKLGVNSRSMAISKSFAMGGLPRAQPVENTEGAAGLGPEAPPTNILERRPVAVLSLRATSNDGASKELSRIYAEVAFDFGAVFRAHGDGRCDMIFGLGHVRRHDVLRAIRAAVAVSELCRPAGGDPIIAAGLAAGYLLASTDANGEWTGETIGGPVIPEARERVAAAAAGRLHLGGAVMAEITDLDVVATDGAGMDIPLDPDFRWRRVLQPPATPLRGRRVEVEVLRSRANLLRQGVAGTVFLEGEAGVGKSALLHAFREYGFADGFHVETWLCSIPDSQPGTPSLGRLEESETGEVLETAAFVSRMARTVSKSDAAAGAIVLIDDAHLLPDGHLESLAGINENPDAPPALIVVAYRGRVPVPALDTGATETLRPGRLTAAESRDVVADFIGPDHSATERIVGLASGTPGFLTRLSVQARDAGAGLALTDQNEAESHNDPRLPPLILFATVAERIEAHGLDRRLLHMVARLRAPVLVSSLRARWPRTFRNLESEIERAVDAGVLTRTRVRATGRGRKDESIQFTHPLLRWVAAFTFATLERPLG